MSWKRRARQGAPVEYTLFEARPRLGGSLASEIVDGAVLERGPDSFLDRKAGGRRALPRAGPWRRADSLERCRAQDLYCRPQPPGAAARRAHVPGAHQADSHRADAPLQPAHQDSHGAGAAASAAAQRRRTNPWPRWSSATLAARPSTGWPIRCSAASTAATPRN